MTASVDALLASAPSVSTKEEAYTLCERLAKTHYENFSVGSWFLPRESRKHFYAVYAFCRFVDDLGDEFEGDRLQALDFWEDELRKCYDGTPKHPYMIALQETISTFDVPDEPFLRLIQANRMDQASSRYATYADLDRYCQHSANPVGHLVLYVSGYRDEARQQLSDYTCTALQLANFWQDVSRDYAIGRIYIPLEDLQRFGCNEGQIASGTVDDGFRELMKFEVDRARELFDRGLELVDTLEGRLKLDIALFSLGGMKVLDAIERQRYDVLRQRPRVSKAIKIRLMLGTALKLKLLGRI